MNSRLKKIIKYFIPLSVVIILFSFKTFGQNTEQVPLDSVLQNFEKRFGVAFTYADDAVLDKYATLPAERLSLIQCIQQVEKQTGLQFKILNERYIAISENNHRFQISGRIIDKNTKQEIEGAYVFTGSNYSVSNQEGRFTFKGNALTDSTLTISHIGYKSMRFAVGDLKKDSVTCELIPQNSIINEIVVNYIAKGINKLADGSIQLNVENIETLPGLTEPDVLHTVQIMPGIESLNETVSDINIRGGTNDQNLVLWDGVKVYQTGHFFGLISAFNSQLISKSVIVKNGTSTAYGEGVSGVIDIQQQNDRPRAFEFGGGLNLISADFTAKIPVNQKVSVIFGGRRSMSDLVITPTYRSYYNRAFQNTNIAGYINSNDNNFSNEHNFLFYDLSSKVFYDISEKDKIRLNFLRIDDLISYEKNTFVTDTSLRKKSSLTQKSILSDFDYSHSWNKKNSSSVFVYLSNYNLDGVNVDEQNSQTHNQANYVTDWGFKLSSRNYLNQSDYLFSGYQFNEIGVQNIDNVTNPDYRRNIKEVLRIHSVFSEATFTALFNHIYLRFGMRANYITKFDKFLFEPRVSVNIELNDYFNCEILAEMKNQYTAQVIDYQTDFLGIEKRRWVVSNNNKIPVINSNQFSVGASFNKNNLLTSVEIYRKQIGGIITPSQGFQNQFEYVFAVGKYDTQGLEVLINKRIKKANGWISYTFSENDYSFQGLIPPNFPNNLDIRHSLSLGGTVVLKGFEISSGFNYRTGKPFTSVAPENKITDDKIEYKIPNASRNKDFSRLDVSAIYKFSVQKRINGKVGISVWNVLDKQNIINTYYHRNSSNEIEKINQYSLGITPNINLRFDL